MFSKHLRLSVALAVGVLSAAAAHAQDRERKDNTFADVDLEVLMKKPLVVTAQRREQWLQDVPMSLSVYDERTIEALGMKSIDDLSLATPGMHFTQQNQYGGTAQSNLQIRGIQSRTGGPTTAVYLDDTPLLVKGNNFNNGAALVYPHLFDLERVEVLRGPQGTLFGASAEGGAVRFITNAPSVTHYTAHTRAEFSWTERGDPSYEAGAVVGGPLIEDALGWRASAWYREEGGWIDRCTPAVAQAGCLAIADHDANSTASYGMKLAALWLPSETVQIIPSLFYQRTHSRDGGGYENAISDAANGELRFALGSALPATDPVFIPTLKVDVDLGGASLTSVTSYVWREFAYDTDYTEYQDFAFFGNPYPLTGLEGDYARGRYIVTQDNVYQEVRLTSTDSDSRLRWVTGLYAERASQSDHSQVAHPNLPALILERYGNSIENVLGVGPYQDKWVYWGDAPAVDKQFAIFGSADYKLVKTLELSLGARWSTFETESDLFVAGSFSGGEQRFSGKTDSSAFTPRAALTWHADEQSMYYVSASKGFRNGGVNTQRRSNLPSCDVTAPEAFAPDSLWSYEVGTKSRFLDDRLALDASAFYIDWHDIQSYTQVPQCGIGVVLNIGSAVSKGFDLSLRALLASNFRVDLKLGYTDTYFTRTVDLPGIGQVVTRGDAIAGASLLSGPAVPPWSTVLAAEYTFDLFDHPAFVSLEDQFKSRNHGPFSTKSPANTLTYDPSLATDPSVNILSLRTGVRGKNSEIALFIDNALDTHPQLSMNHALPGSERYWSTTVRPMTIGLSATYRY